MRPWHLAFSGAVLLVACKSPEITTEGQEAARGLATSTAPPAKAPAAAAPLKLGAPIDEKAPSVALGDVAKAPKSFTGKTFTTSGTITSVCQHMGCWMEIKDDAGEAHIKMAGHRFFVPKTASGRRARVLATLDDQGGAACSDENEQGKGCGSDPSGKLALVAEGVELL